MLEHIHQVLNDCRLSLEQLMKNEQTLKQVEAAAMALAHCLNSGGRAFSCGNGGSMSDAMHFAEELSGRFRESRKPLAATAISDPGHITCTGNDFGYEYVFSRYIEAHARKGDILLAISTSGTSKNVIRAMEQAKALGAQVIGLTGKEDTPMKPLSDFYLWTKGEGLYADRVQELHIKCIHILIELCEKQLFGGETQA
ncbi:MAG: SIS domain-containing protein [Oligoflexales bacterium]|nr:SIS domain-containing protein [Oligoflexales bacterium]